MLDPFTRPAVGQVSGWDVLFRSAAVEFAVAENHRAFFRVRPAGGRPRYFYGESAHDDARRFAADLDFEAWGV